MAKYIIDIPDDSDTKYTYDQDTKELKFPSPRIDFTNLMGLEIVLKNVIPHTEPDRKAIEDAQEEAWEFAKQVTIMTPDDKCELWGTSKYNTINLGYSYAEAKAKYEAWMKQKDEICIGDEVEEIALNMKGIVTWVGDASCSVIWDDGRPSTEFQKELRRTGRHFDEVEELLEKINED